MVSEKIQTTFWATTCKMGRHVQGKHFQLSTLKIERLRPHHPICFRTDITHRELQTVDREFIMTKITIPRLQPRRQKKISIINCYSTSCVANQSELDAFHNQLRKVMQNEKSSYKLVVGDLNARVETMDEKHYRIGKFGLGDRNENGERFAALLSTARLFHGNAFSVKKEHRQWT
ncbi:hypothetical protein DICVIV_07716 [Dictyocaulus viviparus]|uniref:Endonuclease/exonuclease/phosphatase domain-containing protein n=1 Tax=Dictyocaulus viviparus TaxID=29172 RepID=A0A0D8XR48_DICVI|nr:hypothetical protein DICVIV_07716 [Dictyocaulus viviparus]